MSIKHLTITKAILARMLEHFDFESTKETPLENGKSLHEYDQCEYWLNEDELADSCISTGIECFIKYSAVWLGFVDGRDYGKTTIHLKIGDQIPVTFCNDADYLESLK